MCILIFPSKMWAKKCTLYMAKYGIMRNTWDSRSPSSHSATIPAGFHSQKLQGLCLLALEPWAGEPGSSGNLGSEIVFLTFICHMQVWGQPILCSHPPPVSMWLLLVSLVVRLLFSYILGGSTWCLFYSLVVILVWLWEDVSTVFTYSAILTGHWKHFGLSFELLTSI